MAVASVTPLSSATSPAYWDFYVKMVHPCRLAVFIDNGGVSSPIVAIVEAVPYPFPYTEIVGDFPYDLEGSYVCGT